MASATETGEACRCGGAPPAAAASSLWQPVAKMTEADSTEAATIARNAERLVDAEFIEALSLCNLVMTISAAVGAGGGGQRVEFFKDGITQGAGGDGHAQHGAEAQPIDRQSDDRG